MGSMRNYFYRINLIDVGYIREGVEKIEDGKEYYTLLEMDPKAQGKKNHIRTEISSICNNFGEILRVEEKTLMHNVLTTLNAKVIDEKVYLIEDDEEKFIGEAPQNKLIHIYALLEKMIEKEIEETSYFEIALNSRTLYPVKVALESIEDEIYTFRSTNLMTNSVTIIKTDKDALVIESKINYGALQIEQEYSNSDMPIEKFIVLLESNESEDIFKSFKIKDDFDFADRFSVKSVTYKVEFLEDLDEHFLDVLKENYLVKKLSKKRYEITVCKALQTHVVSLDQNEIKDYLSETKYLNYKKPRFVKKIKSIVKGYSSIKLQIDALEEWVNEFILNKRGGGLLSAWHIYNMKIPSGDCGNHAVLLAAALRAAEIPSRLVYGFMQFCGSIAQHAWCEAYYDGRWHGIDATSALKGVSTTNIKLAELYGSDDGYFKIIQKILVLLEDINIVIKKVERNDETIIDPKKKKNYQKITNKGYEDELWNFSQSTHPDYTLKMKKSFRTPLEVYFTMVRRCTISLMSLPNGIRTKKRYDESYDIINLSKRMYIVEGNETHIKKLAYIYKNVVAFFHFKGEFADEDIKKILINFDHG